MIFQRLNNRAYSLADQFELLTRALVDRAGKFPLKTTALLGPDSLPPQTSLTDLSPLAFRDAASAVLEFIRTEHRVPSRVFVGTEPVAPADFLVALASAWTSRQQPGQSLLLGHNVRVLAERQIAEDTTGLFGGWIIHKENFRAPKVMEHARLQAWTLKPALPKSK